MRAREVLHYFVRNPQAADTLEGVARWRLLQEAVYRGLRETRQALDWLVARGYLKRVSTPHSEGIYQLNLDRATQARHFLARTRTSSAQPQDP
jgi:hypothetical protein